MTDEERLRRAREVIERATVRDEKGDRIVVDGEVERAFLTVAMLSPIPRFNEGAELADVVREMQTHGVAPIFDRELDMGPLAVAGAIQVQRAFERPILIHPHVTLRDDAFSYERVREALRALDIAQLRKPLPPIFSLRIHHAEEERLHRACAVKRFAQEARYLRRRVKYGGNKGRNAARRLVALEAALEYRDESGEPHDDADEPVPEPQAAAGGGAEPVRG